MATRKNLDMHPDAGSGATEAKIESIDEPGYRSNTGIDLFPAGSPNAEFYSILWRSFFAELDAKEEAEFDNSITEMRRGS